MAVEIKNPDCTCSSFDYRSGPLADFDKRLSKVPVDLVLPWNPKWKFGRSPGIVFAPLNLPRMKMCATTDEEGRQYLFYRNEEGKYWTFTRMKEIEIPALS